jgi:hypothetical protein
MDLTAKKADWQATWTRYAWLRRDAKNMVGIPFVMGLFFGTGVFLGHNWLSRLVGIGASWILPSLVSGSAATSNQPSINS